MGRTRKKTAHNQGRKPLYKEHGSRLLMPGDDDTHLRVTLRDEAGLILDRGPRYKWGDGGGAYYDQRLAWSESDTRDLAVLCGASADIQKCGDVLAREPKTIAHRASDLGFKLPSAWASLIRTYKPRGPGIELCYPFIAKARPEHADLMRANSLVPRGFPEHMRADICQSVMLAMFEGTVTLSDIEKNKDKMRWFIGKFYKEQRPWQEVLDSPADSDDRRSYDEKAAHGWAQDKVDAEIGERRHAFSAFANATDATQLDHVYALEIREAQHRGAQRRDYMSLRETMETVDGGAFDHGPVALALQVPHAITRAAQRYGITLLPRDLRAMAAQCANRRPLGVERNSEAHLVAVNGTTLPVLFSRMLGKIMTILPPVEMEGLRLVQSGALTWENHHEEWILRRRERPDRMAQNARLAG